jgi:hypothetical protein
MKKENCTSSAGMHFSWKKKKKKKKDYGIFESYWPMPPPSFWEEGDRCPPFINFLQNGLAFVLLRFNSIILPIIQYHYIIKDKPLDFIPCCNLASRQISEVISDYYL